MVIDNTHCQPLPPQDPHVVNDISPTAFLNQQMGSPQPFLDLPNELLIEVFSQCDNTHILSLVCHDFCDIINSTPSFWSFVCIGPRQHTPEGPAFLSRRLERGVACRLNVVIRDIEPWNDVARAILQQLSVHRHRIRTFDVGTDTWILCGQIIQAVLLSPSAPSSLPSLHELDLGYVQEEDVDVLFERDPMEPHSLLRPIATFFPTLTTLVLPLMLPFIPFPDSPIVSLKTLVLDGSMSCDYPRMLHVAQLLVRTPNLETFWCKEHRIFTYEPVSNLNSHTDHGSRCPPVHTPVVLSKLTKLALTVPGFGCDLLKVIEVPALQDLHMDGIRDDEGYGYEVAWDSRILDYLRTSMFTLALHSPELRRLSLVGAYLWRDTWEWVLGCGHMDDIPFPLLDSISVRQMKAVKDEVTNAVDDALIYSYLQQGRLMLRRFAYLASEPPLSEVALQHLIDGLAEKQGSDQVFELELDVTSGIYSRKGLDDVSLKGVRVIIHEEPPRRNAWWTLGKDVDPTERDSY